jgi:hypothetical protein
MQDTTMRFSIRGALMHALKTSKVRRFETIWADKKKEEFAHRQQRIEVSQPKEQEAL